MTGPARRDLVIWSQQPPASAEDWVQVLDVEMLGRSYGRGLQLVLSSGSATVSREEVARLAEALGDWLWQTDPQHQGAALCSECDHPLHVHGPAGCVIWVPGPEGGGNCRCGRSRPVLSEIREESRQ